MKRLKNWTLYVLLSMGVIFVAACDKSDSEIQPADDPALKSLSTNSMTDQCAFVETADLTQEEVNMLQFMKEEEKLARDVYLALYEKWNALIFSNISKSEEQHISAVVRLMEHYDLETIALGEPGVFEDLHFTELYNELVTKGSVSMEEALLVGALIEDLDIKDLQDYIDQTSNDNLIMVFSNLERGSRNHLRAFTRQLSNLGLSYTPQYISQEEYEAIINSPVERGNGNQQGNRNGRQGKGSGNGSGQCDGGGQS